MPDMDGISATAEIRGLAPAAAVLVLRMRDHDQAVFAALRAGARDIS